MRLTANLLARTLAQIINAHKGKELTVQLDNFAKFLVLNSWASESKIKKIFSAYELFQSINGETQKVNVYSARKLTSKENDEVVTAAKKIGGKDIEIVNKINKELIGGIVLEGYDWRFSADVKSNLEKLRANLVNS